MIGEIICKAVCPLCGRQYKIHSPDSDDQRICLSCKIEMSSGAMKPRDDHDE